MEKVTLTKAQADALIHTQNIHRDKHSLDGISSIIEYHGADWENESAPLNELSLDTLIRALYIGYEVEQTPEDSVLELYKEAEHHENENAKERHYQNTQYWSGCKRGIRDTLNTLNIKIKGINV